MRPSGFAASLPVIVAAAFRLGLIAVIALAGVAVVAVGVYAFTTASAGRPR